MQIDGINGKMKRPEKHRRGRGFWKCRGLGGPSTERVGRLYGLALAAPKPGRCRVSGWPHGITGHGHVARPRSSAAKGIKEVSGSPPLPLRGLRRHSLDICQQRGSAIRQGKCFATTRFRCLSVNAYPTIKKAATLSLNVSAQNIPTLVGKSIMLRDVCIYLQ